MHGPKGDIPYTVGGSDVAAIFGVSPWTTPLELWMIKKGRMKPKEKSNANQLTMQVPCPITKFGGKTLGEVLTMDPGAIKWVATKFTGSEEIKAAAQLICNYAMQQATA